MISGANQDGISKHDALLVKAAAASFHSHTSAHMPARCVPACACVCVLETPRSALDREVDTNKEQVKQCRQSSRFPLFMCTGTQQTASVIWDSLLGKTNCKQQQVCCKTLKMNEMINTAIDSWVDNSLPRTQSLTAFCRVAYFHCQEGCKFCCDFPTLRYSEQCCVLARRVIEQHKKRWRDIMWEAWGTGGHLKSSQKQFNQADKAAARPAASSISGGAGAAHYFPFFRTVQLTTTWKKGFFF